MEIERQYCLALELTRQMLDAAMNQEWETLGEYQEKRAKSIAALSPGMLPIDKATANRITQIIKSIEVADAQIVDQVQTWQNHVRILLHTKTPAN